MSNIVYNGILYDNRSQTVRLANQLFDEQFCLIETLLYDNGRMPHWVAHGRRIKSSFQALGWLLPERFLSVISDSIVLLLSQQPECKAKIRLRLLRNEGAIHYLLEAQPVLVEAALLNVGIARGVRIKRTKFSFLKSNNRRPYLIAAQEAVQSGLQDMLLLNEAGRIVESTIANVFWEKSGHLFTPPLTEGCVAGVYRGELLSKAVSFRGLSLSEKELTIEAARAAEALYLTNAVRGIRKIDNFIPLNQVL